MKILLPHRPGGAFGYITDGWLNALKNRGHDVRRYDGNIQTWNQFDPDLYIGCSGHKQPIPSARRAKVAIHVNPYGPVKIDGINENAESIDWTIKQKPDAVFGYGFHSDRLIWSDWTNKHGIEWVPMPTAADKTLFRDLGNDRPHDVVYLGGRWSYKGLTIDAFLIPMLRDRSINFSLHGWGDWPGGFCKGVLPEDKVVEFLNSGKVGPCISERHTQQFGIDIPERVWKLALCGTLAVHDPVPTIRDHFKSLLVSQEAQHYKNMCVHYSRPENDDERRELVERQKAEVLGNHTYHHRLSRLFSRLGWQDEADHMVAE